MAGSSFGGGTFGVPFLPRILRFFCYLKNFKGYFLFSCLFGCGSNPRGGSFLIFNAWIARMRKSEL